MAADDQALLAAGVDPAAVATLTQDRAALAERENAAALDKIAPIISEAEATAELDKIAPIISEEEAQLDAIAPVIDPVQELDSDALFELAKTKEFSPVEWAQQNPQRVTDPDAVKKLRDVHARIRERGFVASDLPSVGTAAKGVGTMVAGLAKQGWNYLNAFVGVPLAGVAGTVTGQGPGFSEALTQEGQRRMIENLAGTEAAVTGMSQLPGRAISKAVHRAGTISGLGKPYDQQTDAEKTKAFFDDLGKATAAGEIAQGRGGLTQAVSGEIQKELAEAEKPIRPEEIETLAAGDPLSFLTFGKAFGAAGGVVGKAIPKSVAPLIERAGAATERAAAQIAGRTIQTAGKLTEWGGVATKVTGKALPIIGAIKGTAVAGPAGTIGGLAAGSVAGRAAERIGRTIDVAGEGITAFGKQAATGAATTPYSQLARDIFQSAPIMASETLKGAAFDVGLSAATSESPQETEAAVAFGTLLGGLKGAGRGALKVAQGQIITPRAWGTAKATPAYRNFSTLDALHSQAVESAAPGQVQRANAIREFLGNKVEAYLMPDAASMEKALIERGVAPEQAKAAAESSQGMFTGELKDDAGKSRRVVFLNNADAAPHEAFHGLQDVLGENANSVVDGLVFQEYAPQWESLGQQYAKRLGGTGNWREIVLDRSGWGNAAAAEKAVRDAANKIEADTGAVPTPEAARALAEGVLSEARRNSAGWRDILTPEEAAAEANRYLARELAAENFDVAFKRLGSGLTEGNSLPEKLARVVARTAAFFGAEPLAGVKTEGLKIEPRQAVVEAVTAQGRGARTPEIAPRTAPEPSKLAEAVKVPETVAEAAKGEALAAELAARDPAQAEVLRKISSAIATGQALKIDYRSAPNEPAGSLNMSREARRTIIEAFRDMPESARPLWEKTAIPFRLEPTKNKGVQILTWSPEVLAANAHKMAKFISEAQLQRLSPYEVDLATKSFTPEGWQKLYDDVQTFTKNQQAGGTGSGIPLKLPTNAAEMQVSVPALNEAALAPLPQATADFINVIFHLPPPETPRVSRKGGTPGNIVAQEIARANEPLIGPRVVEPGRARSEKGFKGFEGRRIQEVNPLRAELEKAATTSKVAFPSLIETNQRLNLEHLVDANPVPEVAAIKPVTDILRAGFLPSAEKTWKITGQRGGLKTETTVKALDETTARKLANAQNIRVDKASVIAPTALLGQFSPVAKERDGIKVAAIRTPDGKIFTGSWHGEAVMNYVEAVGRGEIEVAPQKNSFEPAYDEGFLTESGRYLNREEAAAHASRIGQLTEAKGELETDFFRRNQQFLPKELAGATTAKELSDKIVTLPPEQFKAAAESFTGKFGGGQAGLAFELGAAVKDATDLAVYSEALRSLDAAQVAARAAKDIDAMFSIPSKKQFFTELLETAKDGNAADYIRKHYDPEYKAPFPKEKPLTKPVE